MTPKQRSNLSQDTEIDDEIDLIELFKTLWSYKKYIIITTLALMIIASIYSIVAPKQYQARTSFFLTNCDTTSNSLMDYASILGISAPSNIESLIKNVLESDSIKKTISQKFKPYYSKKINRLIQKGKLQNLEPYIEAFIINELRLRKHFSFSVNKNSLFELTYHSKDPELAKQILETYLDQIIQFNYNLDLSAEKNIITVIDPPELPLSHFKPKLNLNIIIAFILGLFSSTTLILIQTFIKSKK